MAAVAASAGISAETLRKIETGRAPTPAFFTVAALAGALGLSLDELLGRCGREAAASAEAAGSAGSAGSAGPAEPAVVPLIA